MRAYLALAALGLSLLATSAAGISVLQGSSFHVKSPAACQPCHDFSADRCGECHRFGGSVHPPTRRGECSLCHGAPPRRPSAVGPLCVGCHSELRGKRHPRIGHALFAPRDPLRPGKSLDCVSCHDAHSPGDLGRQQPEERRRWCKKCHAKT